MTDNKLKTIKMFTSFLLAYSSTVISSNVLASDNSQSYADLSLEELMDVKVFIASGTEQKRSKASSTVSIITEDDIKKTGATNLTDILESIPGIHIKYDSFGNRPQVYMRGGNSTHTLLMINGNPKKDLLWVSGMFWKGLPVSMIERIEVIRGPGSALYGADAAAGVINVISKTAGKIEQTEVGFRAGSFDSQDAWIQSGGELNGFDLGFTADLSTTDGHDPFIFSDRQGQSGTNHYGWKNADLRFSIAKDSWHLLANYERHDDIETAMTGSGNFDPVTQANDQRYDIDLLYKNNNFSQNLGIDAKLHYQDLNYSSDDGFRETYPSSDYPQGKLNQMSSSERQLHFEVSGLYSAINDHSIKIGAGYQWQDIYYVEQKVNYLDSNGNPLSSAGPLVDIANTASAFAPEQDRKIHFLFLQDVWTINQDWELTAGIRYDYYSDFGDTINPRLSLVWQTTEKLTSKLMYGQAFRAPSFQELYADTSRAKSNSELQPENSETIELALTYVLSRTLNFGLNLYQYKLSDSISKDSNRQFQNFGDHDSLGIEFESSWQAMDSLRLSANYSYRNPQDNNLRVKELPEQEAYIRSDWQFISGWNWNIQANWIADRIRADNDTRENLDDYVITDTTLRYTGLKQWQFSASIRNLFDEDAREHTGMSVSEDLPLPERNFYLQASYQFK